MLVLISISPNANIKYVIFRGRSSDQLIAEIRNQTPKLFHTITNNENKKKNTMKYEPYIYCKSVKLGKIVCCYYCLLNILQLKQ